MRWDLSTNEEIDGNTYIAMEFTQNGALLDLVMGLHAAKEGVSEHLAKFFFRRLIKGLDYMHSRDFVHLDIKHDNILLDAFNEPKLADFGFAQKVTGPITFNKYTKEYAAPEVLRPTGPYDGKKADIYSMGVVFYSTFNCKYPPSSGALEFPPGTSDAIKVIIKAMLSKNPADRPSTSDLLTQFPYRDWFKEDTITQPDYDRYVLIATERSQRYLMNQSQVYSAY